MIVMVSRLRNKLTVQERTAIFEHTNKVAADAAEEERRLRAEKTERLRRLRLEVVATVRSSTEPVRRSCISRQILGDQDMDQQAVVPRASPRATISQSSRAGLD